MASARTRTKVLLPSAVPFIVAGLRLKLGYECLLPHSLEHLTGLSQFVDEVANLPPNIRQPYVGRAAFTHKGGLHPTLVEPQPNHTASRDLTPDDRDFFAVYRRLPGNFTVPFK